MKSTMLYGQIALGHGAVRSAGPGVRLLSKSRRHRNGQNNNQYM